MRTIVDGQWTYRCPTCRDSGIVEVWHPRTLQAMRDGSGRNLLQAASTACSCERGNHYVERQKRNGDAADWLPRFGDAEWHCRILWRGRDESAERDPENAWSLYRPDWDVEDNGSETLKAFVSGAQPNYVSEFDEWNNR